MNSEKSSYLLKVGTCFELVSVCQFGKYQKYVYNNKWFQMASSSIWKIIFGLKGNQKDRKYYKTKFKKWYLKYSIISS